MKDRRPDLRREVAFVVLSCDRYSDLWEPCIGRLRRYWPQLPLDIYLVANEKVFDGDGARTLNTGDDIDWSTTVRKAVLQLGHPRLFFWFDDVFLRKPVDDAEVMRHLHWAIANDADYLRLRTLPKPDERVAENIGRLKERIPYRNTCFASLWKKDVFLNVLKDGESAAEFEMRGTKRTDSYPRFYGVYHCPLDYVHGVVRGTWLRSALGDLVSTGDVRAPGRPVMSAAREAVWRLNEVKGEIVSRLPPGWAEAVFRMKRWALGRSK